MDYDPCTREKHSRVANCRSSASGHDRDLTQQRRLSLGIAWPDSGRQEGVQLAPPNIERQGHVYEAMSGARDEKIGVTVTRRLFILDDELDVVGAEGLNCVDGSPDASINRVLDIAVAIEVVDFELDSKSKRQEAGRRVKDVKQGAIVGDCGAEKGSRDREVCNRWVTRRL